MELARHMREMTGEEAFAARCAMGPLRPYSVEPQLTIKHEEEEEHGMRGLPMSFSSSANEIYPEDYTGYSTQRMSQEILELDPVDLLDKSICIRPRFKTSKDLQLIMSHVGFKSLKSLGDFPPMIQRITRQFMVANKYLCNRAHLSISKRKTLWQSLLVRLDLHHGEFARTTPSDPGKILNELSSKLGVCIGVESEKWRARGLLWQNGQKSTPILHNCTSSWVVPQWNGLVPTKVRNPLDEVLDEITHLRSDGLPSSRPRTETALVRTEGFQSSESSARMQPPDCVRDQEIISGPAYPFMDQKRSARVPLGDVTRSSVNARPLKRGNEALATQSVSRSIPEIGKPITNRESPADSAILRDPTPSKKFTDRNDPEASRKRRRVNSPEPDYLDTTAFHIISFTRAMESIYLSHDLLAKAAPINAKDLVSLQQSLLSQEPKYCLKDALQTGMKHTMAINRYLRTALELLSVLDEGSYLQIEDGSTGSVETDHENGRLYSPSHVPFTWSKSPEAIASEDVDHV